SYTFSSSNNTRDCAIEAVPGTNPSIAEWNDIFDVVSRGPAEWGDAGPSVIDLEVGCNTPEPPADQAARFPCELLTAIAQVESGWRQFCGPTTPSDQVGGPSRTIISFDCGYGIAQVTSGMRIGETPSYDRERVASDPTYNLATGTRILAEKWSITDCVGDRRAITLEHWYSATWAYNGLSTINNPNNPNFDPNRGVYDPVNGGSRPYQEKVWGRIENTSGQFDPTALAYPNPGDIGTSNRPPDLPDPDCASPTDCTDSRPLHDTACQGDDGAGGAGGGEPSSTTGVTASTGAGGDDIGGGTGGGAVDDDDTSGLDGSDGTLSGSCSCRVVGASSPRAPRGTGWGALLVACLAVRRRRRRGVARR
ncbi:MAG: transglycosylase SLT domain-containing protein, partial [Myxococcota bacterium]